MAARLKKSNNIVARLQLKEIRGSLQTHSHAMPVRMFNKTIPDSLVFNLKDLVPLSVLHDGHVFLGFTKDGQFVLSYTQLMEAEAHTGYPYYEYHLHWWVLQPVTTQQQGSPQRHFRLHKVSQVRLFGEEEIPTDIYLLVCQWPTDYTKVLVHGYSYHHGANSDEKCLCYLTVTAVPPVGPCEDCLQLPQHLDPPEPEDSLSTPLPLRCLRHSFTLHTKYELAPPFPPFHPKVSLKLDGVIVLNTADSLVALSIKTGGEEQSIHVGGGDIEQSNVSRGGDREQSIHIGGGNIEQSIDSRGGDREQEIISSPVLRVDVKVDSELQCKNSSATTSKDQVSFSDDHLEMQSSSTNESYVFDMRVCSGNQGSDNVKTDSGFTDTYGKCNTYAADHNSADDVSGAAHAGCFIPGANSCNTCINSSNASSSAKCCPCSNTEENKNQSEEIARSDSVQGGIVICREGDSLSDTINVNTAVQGSSIVQTAQKTVTPSTDSTPLDSKIMKDCDAFNSSCRNSTALHIKTPEGHGQPSDLLSAASDHDSSSLDSTALHKKTPQGLKLLTDMLSAASDSTTRHSTTGDSRTPEGHVQPSDLLSAASDSSSWDSTVLDCNRSPCFTFTRRQFVYSTTEGGGHLEDTGESGSEYQSMLPLQVHGAGYSSMRLCMGEDMLSTYYGQPGLVEVQELRMDAEQFICDMARQDADWGNRFVAFTDYDMQIIDVCPDSRQLVVLVLALVRARPHYGNCIPKLYQTSFTAAWDLNTGHHQTRDIQPLQEFDQAQLRKVWNPGRAMSRKMQQRWMIPQGYARGVHVMTNEAVFRGHSLSLLWDSTNCIAIVPGRPGR